MRQPVPFGKYLLLDRISVGGMAEVFRAKSFGVEGFEKLIAIKRILPSMADDREFLRMFVDEAKIAGQLSHPSIAQIYELGREGNAPYIAMEYVWGKDLLQIYNRFRKLGERMPTNMACHIVAKACEGLDYAHRKRDPLGVPLQIVHRDCSPQNILVSYEGEVKVIDFGIAKAASRVSHTNAGVLKGKFAYLSPEQVRGQQVDRRSDLFALGTVFYEILTGERLFHSESDFSTLERVRDADVPRPRTVCPDVPEEVERIVLRALAKNPDVRYQHGSEMYRDLQAFLSGQEHPYTASSLGAWIRRAFPEEMERERQLLERYRRIGPDGTARASAPALPGQLDAEVILSSTRRPEDTDAADDDFTEIDEDEGPTLLGGPNLIDVAQGGMASRVPRPGVGASDFADEGPTEIHGEIGSAPRSAPITADRSAEAAPAAITIRDDPFDEVPPGGEARGAEPSAGDELEDLSDELEPAGAQPQRPLHAATLRAPGGPPVRRATSQPPPVPNAAAGRTLRMGAAGQKAGSQSGDTSRVPKIHKEATASVRLSAREASVSESASKPSRSSFVKDIGIGVVIAAALLAVIVAARALLGMWGEAPIERGSLEIDLDGLDDVTVLVNGETVGEAQSGSVVLDDIEAGTHAIDVIRDGETLCSRELTVRAQATSSVSCAAAPALPAALVLEGATEEHRVRIDGEIIDADPAREAIKLSSGTEQEIEILVRDEVVERLFITPAPGELVRRKVGGEDSDGDEGGGDDDDEASAPASEHRAAGSSRSERPSRPRPPQDETRSPVEEVSPSAQQPAREDMGYLIARTRPWARVFIDGRDTGVMTPIAPRARIPVRPGPRRITFVVGDESFTYEVRIKAGETHEITEDLPVDR